MRRAVLVIILAVLLTACASPAYVPDEVTLAEREAQEYATRVTRGAWAWRVFLLFAIAMLTVLTGLVFFLAQVRYKVADAEARKKSADARRALLVAIDAHTVLDLYDNSIRGVSFSQTPTVIPPPFAAPVAQQVPDEVPRAGDQEDQSDGGVRDHHHLVGHAEGQQPYGKSAQRGKSQKTCNDNGQA